MPSSHPYHARPDLAGGRGGWNVTWLGYPPSPPPRLTGP